MSRRKMTNNIFSNVKNVSKDFVNLLFENSEKNKLVIFDSKYKHKAFNDDQVRFVAAGGIYKK